MLFCRSSDLGPVPRLGGCLLTGALDMRRRSIWLGIIAVEPQRVDMLIPRLANAIDLASADAANPALLKKHLELLLWRQWLPRADMVGVMGLHVVLAKTPWCSLACVS